MAVSNEAVSFAIIKRHKVHNVKKFSGKTISVAFTGKASEVGLKVSCGYRRTTKSLTDQSAIYVNGVNRENQFLTEEFARYRAIIDIPEFSSDESVDELTDYINIYFWFSAAEIYNDRTDSLGVQEGTFDITCVDVYEGDFDRPFPEEAESLSLTRLNSEGSFWEGTVCGGNDLVNNYIYGTYMYSSANRANLYGGSKELKFNNKALPTVTVIAEPTTNNATFKDAIATHSNVTIRLTGPSTAGSYVVTGDTTRVDGRY